MSTPFFGEIRLFGGNFAPTNWMFCHGQTLPISEHETLFNLIGTTYGGDGQSTFSLPDLQGRLPIHQGANRPIGEFGGAEQVVLTSQQLPPHTHALPASTATATLGVPTNNVIANTSANGALIYATGGTDTAMSPAAIEPAGLSHPHENRMPYLPLSFIICVDGGVFPPRS